MYEITDFKRKEVVRMFFQGVSFDAIARLIVDARKGKFDAVLVWALGPPVAGGFPRNSNSGQQAKNLWRKGNILPRTLDRGTRRTRGVVICDIWLGG